MQVGAPGALTLTKSGKLREGGRKVLLRPRFTATGGKG